MTTLFETIQLLTSWIDFGILESVLKAKLGKSGQHQMCRSGRWVPNMAEVGNCPIFVAKNGNVVHISADWDTKIINETKISFSEGRKTEIVNIIVQYIGNYRS